MVHRHVLVIVFSDKLLGEPSLILVHLVNLHACGEEDILCRLVHFLIVDFVGEAIVLIPSNVCFVLEVCWVTDVLFPNYLLLILLLFVFPAEPTASTTRFLLLLWLMVCGNGAHLGDTLRDRCVR